MIIAEECFLNCINSPVRQIKARVELYNGSTLLHTFKQTDRLKSITIDRIGEEGKFFGFGICQRVNIKLIDTKAELDISTENTLDIAFGTGSEFLYPFPLYRVSEVHRDENTNELSITAYDALYFATLHNVSELEIITPYTIGVFATACGAKLGLPVKLAADGFDTVYDNGANFEGNETIRDALNAIAEATQTIYFVNNELELTFIRLDISGAAVYDITKDRYFTLESSTNRRLTNITHTTELGDNVSAALDISGSTQFIRDNPFLEMREDVGTLLETAIDRMGGISINQFSCNWRGNYLLEIGDKISLTTKEGGIVYSYVLDDTISFDGSYSQKTAWKYTGSETETASNPSTLGDALKQTYAKVDKVNKEIAIVASEAANNAESISSILLNTESITASVKKIEEDTADTIETLNNELATLSKSVSAAITAEDVKIEIQTELANGVDKVITNTGFTFNSDGLKVAKTDSEMETSITEDGMRVSKNSEVVLTANNVGVDAVNLHATTYLIVGENSRFENYGYNRTGCFWIGGE